MLVAPRVAATRSWGLRDIGRVQPSVGKAGTERGQAQKIPGNSREQRKLPVPQHRSLIVLCETWGCSCTGLRLGPCLLRLGWAQGQMRARTPHSIAVVVRIGKQDGGRVHWLLAGCAGCKQFLARDMWAGGLGRASRCISAEVCFMLHSRPLVNPSCWRFTLRRTTATCSPHTARFPEIVRRGADWLKELA